MKNLFSNKGNGIIETILFVPFAFLFLFSSIDLGLAYKDRGAILGAVNSAFNEEVLYNKKYKLYSLDDSADIYRNVENFNPYLEEINQLIINKITATRGQVTNPESMDINLSSSIVELKIDTENGKLLNYEIHNPTHHSSLANSTDSNLEHYIQLQLQSCIGSSPCRYALPTNIGSSEKTDYQPYSILLAIGIKANSYGISKEINMSLLGKIFSVDEKYLKLLRIQIN